MANKFNNKQVAHLPNKPVVAAAQTEADLLERYRASLRLQYGGQTSHGTNFTATGTNQPHAPAVQVSQGPWIAPRQQSSTNYFNSFFNYSGRPACYAPGSAAQLPTGSGPWHWSRTERCFLPGRTDLDNTATSSAAATTTKKVDQHRFQQYDNSSHHQRLRETKMQYPLPGKTSALIDEPYAVDDASNRVPQPSTRVLRSHTRPMVVTPSIQVPQSNQPVLSTSGIRNGLIDRTYQNDARSVPRPQDSGPSSLSLPPRARSPLNTSEVKRPSPHTDYHAQSRVTPAQVSSPRRLLVILDLNGTLLFRRSRGGSNFTRRPHLDEFLKYLFQHHSVMVWSSARLENVVAMCDKLFTQAQRESLVAIWAREQLRLTPAAFKERVPVYKQLSWVWNGKDMIAKRPFGAAWNQTDTVLIDDSVDKAATEPHNVIPLEAFEATPQQMESDVLAAVATYLDVLKMQDNVSAYMRQQPFVVESDTKTNWDALINRY